MKNLFKQIIKFGIVGGIAFLIDYSLLYILTEFLGIYYLYSSIISFIVSLIFNYIASIKWVFDVSQKQTLKDLIILNIIGDHPCHLRSKNTAIQEILTLVIKEIHQYPLRLMFKFQLYN